MVASFTAPQLFSAYIFVESSANLYLSYNTSPYHDIKVAVYQYIQIVYRYTSNMHKLYLQNVGIKCILDPKLYPVRKIF